MLVSENPAKRKPGCRERLLSAVRVLETAHAINSAYLTREGERRSMASPSSRKRIRINLQCTKCGRQFVDWARFVSIDTADRGTIEWMPDNDATMGTKCPRCGSEAIVVARP
jgi:DNA-directed RNA polymerase subunit RPC12/RpoP